MQISVHSIIVAPFSSKAAPDRRGVFFSIVTQSLAAVHRKKNGQITKKPAFL
jgi:hypothetical protein